MEAIRTFVIEASRQNAENVDNDTTGKSTDNARWTNRVNFNFQQGDKVNLEYSVIHAIGESEDGTVEVTGQNDPATGLCDNVVGLKFQNYVCDNGYNTLKLPYVGGVALIDDSRKLDYTPEYKWTEFNLDESGGGNWEANDTFEVTTNTANTGVVVSTQQVTFDGQPWEFPYTFRITSDTNWLDWFDKNKGSDGLAITKTTSGGDGNTIYVKAYGTDTDKPEANADTLAGYDTIGMTIHQNVANDTDMEGNYGMPLDEDGYNFTFAYEANSKPQIVAPNNVFSSYALPLSNGYSAMRHSITGEKYTKLQTNYKGPYRSNSDVSESGSQFYSGEDDLYPMYSEVVFSIDAPSYESPTTIANLMNLKLHETNASNETSEGSNIPTDQSGKPMAHVSGALNKIISANGTSGNFWKEIAVRDLNKWKGIHAMMRCELAFDGKLRFHDSTTDYFYPRPAIAFDGTSCKSSWHNQGVVETSALPCKRYPFTFTAKGQDEKTADAYYTCLPKYFLVTTNIKYTEANINRIRTWFSNNEVYDGEATDPDLDVENWRVMADLGSSRDGMNTTNERGDNDQYAPPTYAYRFLTTGLPYGSVDGYVSTFAYSLPVDPYNVHEKIPYLGYSASSPRSDYWTTGTTIQHDTNEYTIESIATDVPHRFKDNKHKDTSMALFSRLLPDYQSKIRVSNTDDADEDNWHEGNGKYNLDPTADGVDVSLSGELGVYGVNILKEDDEADQYVNLVPNGKPTYWRGQYYDSFEQKLETVTQYIYAIDTGTDDQATYGGYDMRMFNFNKDMPKLDDIYIYSSHNFNYKTGHNVDGVTFDGGSLSFDEEDENHLLFYKDDTHMWLGVMSDDINDYKKYAIYYSDNMPSDQTTQQPFREWEEVAGIQAQRDVKTIWIQTNTDPAKTSAPTFNLNTATDGKYTLNNLNVDVERIDSEKVCAFLLYADSATQSSDGSWEVSSDFALPPVYQGMFFGCSPSFLDNPVVWCVNPMSTNGDKVGGDENCQKWISIGANDPTVEFDGTQSRTVLKQLHTQRQLGVAELPTDGEGNFVMTTLGEQVIKFADNKYPYQRFDSLKANDNRNGYETDAVDNTGLSTTTAGLFVDGVYGQKQGDVSATTDQMTELTDSDKFYNSLLFKMGFEISDLFNTYGQPWNWHTPALKNDVSVANRYKNVKPLTTNAQLSIASQPDVAIQDSSVSGGEGYPTYQLGFGGTSEFNIDGSNSTEIVATNLPVKLESPFYQVYTDIVNTDYFTDGQRMNICGIIPKNYISSDYIYGFSTSYTMPVMFPQKLSSVTTEIRLPNGRLAPINGNSSVIYKVERVIQVAQPQEEQEGG